MRAHRRLFWRPNSDAIALQNAQANRIHQRQNLLRLPASRRGTPCGCPPPLCARAQRRLFWRPNSDAIALQNAQANRIHQRQNLLRLPASRMGTPCGCPPPVCAPIVDYFGVRIQMRLPYRTPRPTASTSDKTSSGCQHPVGAPLVGALPPVCAPIVDYFGVGIQMRLPYRTPRPTASTSDKTSSGCQHPVGAPLVGALPPVCAPQRRLFWRPNSDAIAQQNAQANRIHQRQNLLRLPASRRGTPCGCPPPVCAPFVEFWRPGIQMWVPSPLGQRATKKPTRRGTPCGCPPPRIRAHRRHFGIQIRTALHPLCATLHQRQNLLKKLPESRRGTPCGCPPPLVRAPFVDYFGVRIQMRLPYRTPRPTASTSDKTSSGCQHPVGAPLVGALPPPVYAPFVSYFGVRIQMRLPYRTPRPTASTSDKTSSGCQHPVCAPLVGALPPRIRAHRRLFWRPNSDATALQNAQANRIHQRQNLLRLPASRTGTPRRRPPPPRVRAQRRLFWRPNSDATALQNAQANRIHQRQNLLRLPESRRGTPCGCPPPRGARPKKSYGLFWRPNSDATPCPTERPGQPHPPANKTSSGCQHPVGAPLVGALPPVVRAPKKSTRTRAPRLARTLPLRGHPVSTRRGTPCGCPPPLVRAPKKSTRTRAPPRPHSPPSWAPRIYP